MSTQQPAPKQEDETPTPPKAIQGSSIPARVLRNKIWRAANTRNDWFVFVIVGREGSGKSLTCASILEKVDPSFNANRTHFEAADFLRQVESDQTGTGDAVMLDESGVSMGKRTWYDREQIEFNQLLQTARDDNMIIGITLPRLEELDSQFQGRLHAYLEMTNKEDGEWAELKYMNVSPSRDGRGTIYKKYPRMRVNGRKRKITRLKIGPPSEELTAAYQVKKREWKAGLYEDTMDTLEEDEETEEPKSEKEIVEEIKTEYDIQAFVSTHNGNGTRYLSWKLIKGEFGVGRNTAKTVKEMLEADNEVSFS